MIITKPAASRFFQSKSSARSISTRISRRRPSPSPSPSPSPPPPQSQQTWTSASFVAITASGTVSAYCYYHFYHLVSESNRGTTRFHSLDNFWSNELILRTKDGILNTLLPSAITRCEEKSNVVSTTSSADRQRPALSTNGGESVIVPTMEAAVRAVRLVGTVARMILAYEFAKFETKLPFTIQSKEEEEMLELERAVEQRELELEMAQKAYASESPPPLPTSPVGKEQPQQQQQQQQQSVEDRRQRKQQQKIEMQQAAEKLAEAEEQLQAKEGMSSKSRLHRSQAERLLRLCRRNGGVYIKVGQHLANLDYILPQEYIEVMSSLFNDAPKSSYDDVRAVIEEDLGSSVDELFDDFDPTPLASASLAQVHVAYDKTTKKKLAVKVQHRGLRETSKGDIYAVTTIVGWIDKYFEDFTFGWIADEIAPQLPLELDFQREGKNAERARDNLKGSGLACCIPNVVWESTTPRVLTMDFEDGFKATDNDALSKSKLKRSDVARLISSVFNSQVFDAGFVHVDPHPANVLLREKNGRPEMVLVDHGLYKEIDNDFRLKYAQLWRSLMLADLDGIEKSCSALGVKRAFPLFAAMLTARPYDEIIERSKTKTFSFSVPTNSSSNPDSQADRAVIAGYAKMFISQILALLGDLPRDMLLLLKMNDCLRHIDFALGSPTNTLVVAGKYASRVVYRDQMARDSRLIYRLRWCLEYYLIQFRIQIHNFASRLYYLQ